MDATNKVEFGIASRAKGQIKSLPRRIKRNVNRNDWLKARDNSLTRRVKWPDETRLLPRNTKETRAKKAFDLRNKGYSRSRAALTAGFIGGGVVGTGVAVGGAINRRNKKKGSSTGLSNLLEVFEFAMKLPLRPKPRMVIQGERREKFIKHAERRGFKGRAAEIEGENLYRSFNQKHGIKHHTGNFNKYLYDAS
jgi:hypothetical protein